MATEAPLASDATVPRDIGVDIPVSVGVGDYKSPPAYFSYDPPFISRISPQEPDAAGDRIVFSGKNFGSTEALAGDVNVTIGGRACTPIIVGGVRTSSIWMTQQDTPYLQCLSAPSTVGPQELVIRVAGQNRTYARDDEAIIMTCADDWYGQMAWATFHTFA